MGINDNVENYHRDANLENTTRQGNTYDGADPPVMVREGPEDQPQELVEGEGRKTGTTRVDTPQFEPFDPGNTTVDGVKDYVTAHPDQRAVVTAEEQAGKNRVTLLTWLQSREDEVTE